MIRPPHIMSCSLMDSNRSGAGRFEFKPSFHLHHKKRLDDRTALGGRGVNVTPLPSRLARAWLEARDYQA